MTINVASVPKVVTAFSMADLWVLVNNGEPKANLDDTRTDSFSLAVAIGLATSPASVSAKLVIRTVARKENLRIFNIAFNQSREQAKVFKTNFVLQKP